MPQKVAPTNYTLSEPSESDLHVEVAAEVDLGLEGLARPQLGRLDGRERVLQRQELGDLLVHLARQFLSPSLNCDDDGHIFKQEGNSLSDLRRMNLLNDPDNYIIISTYVIESCSES